MQMQTAMQHNVDVPTMHDTMSHGDRDRASALRQYKRLRSNAAHALAIAEHPRCGLDTGMRLRDEADSWFQLAEELDRDWNFTGRYANDGAAIA